MKNLSGTNTYCLINSSNFMLTFLLSQKKMSKTNESKIIMSIAFGKRGKPKKRIAIKII